jgi:hypothetical protein
VGAAGGTPPYTFAIAPALPSGMFLNNTTGLITGTPTASRIQTSYTVTVQDAAVPTRATSTATFQLTVNPRLSVVLLDFFKTCEVAFPCTFSHLQASGGTPPLTHTITPALPPNLTSTLANGLLTVSGTPAATMAPSVFAVSVRDAIGTSVQTTIDLQVNPALTTSVATPLVECTQHASCGPFAPVQAAGGVRPYAFAISPALPPDLVLSSSLGAFSGIPTQQLQTSPFTITVTDFLGATSLQQFQLRVNPPPVATLVLPSIRCNVSTDTCVQNIVGNPPITLPARPVTGSGGTQPLTYFLTGALPPGMSYDGQTGELSVTNLTATMALTNYTVTVLDARGASASRVFSLVVQP